MPERPAGSERHTGSAPGWDRRGTVGRELEGCGRGLRKRERTRVHAGRRLYWNSGPWFAGAGRLGQGVGWRGGTDRPAPARGSARQASATPRRRGGGERARRRWSPRRARRSHAGRPRSPERTSSLTRRSAFIAAGRGCPTSWLASRRATGRASWSSGSATSAAGRVSGSSWPPRRSAWPSSGAWKRWPPSNRTRRQSPRPSTWPSSSTMSSSARASRCSMHSPNGHGRAIPTRSEPPPTGCCGAIRPSLTTPA